MEPRYVGEDEAVEQMIEHLRDVADVDDIAQWYSFMIVDYPVIVVPSDPDRLDSDVFQDGERIEIEEDKSNADS